MEVVVTRLMVDGRAQFVALACATIVGRCGVASPVRVLAGTPSVVEELGRSWIAGPSKIVGCTLLFPPSPCCAHPTVQRVHLFIGVSVTLGVVWCNCWDNSTMLRSGDRDGGDGSDSEGGSEIGWSGGFDGAVIQGNVGNLGNDRFVTTSHLAGGGSSTARVHVIERSGRLLASLEGDVRMGAPSGTSFVCNKKWVVKLEMGDDEAHQNKMLLWNVLTVIPSNWVDWGTNHQPPLPVACNCVQVKWGVGCAKFPRFSDPCSDELVLAGISEEGTVCVSFVDLQKSVANRVLVVTNRFSVPHPNPVDMVWDEPDAIVTLHQTATGYDVYNTKSGNLHSFPASKYKSVCMIHPAHICAKLHGSSAESRRMYCYKASGTITEIYPASALDATPCSLIECWDADESSSTLATNKGIFTIQRSIPEDLLVLGKQQTSVSIHDVFAGTSLLVLTITWPTTRTHQSVTIPGLGHTTIGAVVDVRSQFVAFASSSIERCGLGSAAKLVSHNRALCESFGRDWVVGCCRQVGTTIILPVPRADADSDEMEPEWSLEQVNVSIGVSATLGVVWCTCLDYRASGCITVTVGDDRFMCDELKPSCVVDSRGNVVATLGDGEVDKYPVWRTNGKWLVKVDAAKNLVVYRMNNGVPVCPSHATVVRCTSLRPRNDGARFSPFDPCGDEVVLIGERGSGREGGAFISFVDLEKSCGAGVTVEARESHSLPYSEASSFLWSSPDTILTLHRDVRHDCYRVYNTVTGELHTFPTADYYLRSVFARHIVWLKHKSSMYEVYSASDMSTPCCQYEKKQYSNLGDYPCSSDELYVVRRDSTQQDVVDICIHDTKTATLLAFLTIEITY
ncbi:hypothetical protein Pelo_18282 [Pelomyxa schiedti]|nr:hypothetical protein Pelo_18282 [Pelomyxa schiedti]